MSVFSSKTGQTGWKRAVSLENPFPIGKRHRPKRLSWELTSFIRELRERRSTPSTIAPAGAKIGSVGAPAGPKIGRVGAPAGPLLSFLVAKKKRCYDFAKHVARQTCC